MAVERHGSCPKPNISLAGRQSEWWLPIFVEIMLEQEYNYIGTIIG